MNTRFLKVKLSTEKGKANRCCAKFSPIVNFFCESTDRSLMLWIWQTNPHNNQGMPYCFNNKKKIVKKTALYTYYSLTLPWSSSFLKLLHCNLSGLWVSSELRIHLSDFGKKKNFTAEILSVNDHACVIFTIKENYIKNWHCHEKVSTISKIKTWSLHSLD